MPREARSITVYELQFIRWEGDELELEIHCSKGTYIRTITDDLGELLGCGAHVIICAACRWRLIRSRAW